MSEFRYLTQAEISLARSIFGDGISNYAEIKVYSGSKKQLGITYISSDRPHAPDGNIYIPTTFAPDVLDQDIANDWPNYGKGTFLHDFIKLMGPELNRPEY